MSRLFSSLAIGSLAVATLHGAAANDATSARQNLVVVASDRTVADRVAIEVERAAERFCRAFGLPLTHPAPGPPIVIRLGAEEPEASGEGALTLQGHSDAPKIYVLFGAPPWSRDALARGTARAMAVRQALRRAPPQGGAMPPAWVLDGMAALSSPQEIIEAEGARAILLARLAPQLTLEGALGLLEGQALDAESRRGLAGALLAGVSAAPEGRDRLLAALPSFAVDPTAALAETAQQNDLAAWWTAWWRDQSARLPPARLGWRPTLLWILAGDREDGIVSSPEAEVAPVASPWFRPWFQAPPSLEAQALAAIRLAVERRRTEAMAWFEEVDGKEHASRAEWIRVALPAVARDSVATRGPALAWLNTLPQPSRAAGGKAPARDAKSPSTKD